jgi:hypothetical protein
MGRTECAKDIKLMAMQAKIDTLSRGRKGGGETTVNNESGKKSIKPPLIPNPGWLANDTVPDSIDKVMTHRGKKWHECTNPVSARARRHPTWEGKINKEVEEVREEMPVMEVLMEATEGVNFDENQGRAVEEEEKESVNDVKRVAIFHPLALVA